MRTALFGGTFNPIHFGHIYIAKIVLSLGYEQIIFMPAAQSPLKKYTDDANPYQRASMVQLAIAEYPQFIYCDYEIQQQGISYTSESITYIYEHYTITDKLGLILGMDHYHNLNKWHNISMICMMCTLICLQRPHYPPPQKTHLSYPAQFIQNQPIPISSTQIRHHIARTHAFNHLIPHHVYSYIINHHLYQEVALFPASDPDVETLITHLDTYAHHILSPQRYHHSKRVARTAAALARQYHVDVRHAYLVGIAHDIAREYDATTLLHMAHNYAIPIDTSEHPSFLHGPIAAAIMRIHYNITHYDILEAVTHHTLGYPNLHPLGMILFIADYIEPARTHVTIRFKRQIRHNHTLSHALLEVLTHMKKTFGTLHPKTSALYTSLIQNNV